MRMFAHNLHICFSNNGWNKGQISLLMKLIISILLVP